MRRLDREVLLRLFLLQTVEGIPRVRELMRQVQVNLAYLREFHCDRAPALEGVFGETNQLVGRLLASTCTMAGLWAGPSAFSICP